MDDVATERNQDTGSEPTRRSPAPRGRRRVAGEGFRSAHVMGWIALTSLGAAILLSIIIAIARGETQPLYVTWISALIMAAVTGIVAASIVISDRVRASRSSIEAPLEDFEA